jgi:SWI/SNF-related matrix-associated actin-dependent regulator 1 of chromatin subfamily A
MERIGSFVAQADRQQFQFTQVLDILKVILEMQQIGYLVLTGQTAVSERQMLVDQFNEDEGIPVFLLSTRAGQ